MNDSASGTIENKGLNDMYIETPHTLGESYHQYDERVITDACESNMVIIQSDGELQNKPVKSRHSVYGNKEKDHSTNSTMFNANTFQHMDVMKGSLVKTRIQIH